MHIDRWFFFFLLNLGLILPEISSASSPQRVLIVINASDPESVALGEYYASQRSIPSGNIFAFALSAKEVISWGEFITTLLNPLRQKLIEQGWIDGMINTQLDAQGRNRFLATSHKIDYMVLCRGVPLKIANDAARLESEPMPQIQEYHVNNAAIDSELALVAYPDTLLVGAFENPLYQEATSAAKFNASSIVRVARLDGPSHEAVCAMIDHALSAEASGIMGRAYVDYDPRWAKLGNEWLEQSQKCLERLGFPVDTHKGPTLFEVKDRFDAPIFYLGWYASEPQGILAQDWIHFPAGAIALPMHSYSAATLRSSTAHWAGPLINRGVTATIGNVYEPYFQLCHRPQIIMESLASGKEWGAAVYASMPALSWHTIVLGDPLFKPFNINIDQQIQSLELMSTPNTLLAYAVIRKMNLLSSMKMTSPAIQLGDAYFKKVPQLALALTLAQSQASAKQTAALRTTLLYVYQVNDMPLQDRVIIIQLARLAAEYHYYDCANMAYKKFLQGLPNDDPLSLAYIDEILHLATITAEPASWLAELQARLPKPEPVEQQPVA